MGQETADINEQILFIAVLVFFFRKGTAAESDFNRNKDCPDTFRLGEDIDEEIRILMEHSDERLSTAHSLHYKHSNSFVYLSVQMPGERNSNFNGKTD